jgi:DNA-binding Lrp family transcriptional regulator
MPENPERAPIATSDPINARILAVSEDRIQGYSRDPLAAIASEARIPLPQVLERLRALLEAGVIRRIRQTLLATSLAEGALCAWQVPAGRLDEALSLIHISEPTRQIH